MVTAPLQHGIPQGGGRRLGDRQGAHDRAAGRTDERHGDRPRRRLGRPRAPTRVRGCPRRDRWSYRRCRGERSRWGSTLSTATLNGGIGRAGTRVDHRKTDRTRRSGRMGLQGGHAVARASIRLAEQVDVKAMAPAANPGAQEGARNRRRPPRSASGIAQSADVVEERRQFPGRHGGRLGQESRPPGDGVQPEARVKRGLEGASLAAQRASAVSSQPSLRYAG